MYDLAWGSEWFLSYSIFFEVKRVGHTRAHPMGVFYSKCY